MQVIDGAGIGCVITSHGSIDRSRANGTEALVELCGLSRRLAGKNGGENVHGLEGSLAFVLIRRTQTQKLEDLVSEPDDKEGDIEEAGGDDCTGNGRDLETTRSVSHMRA